MSLAATCNCRAKGQPIGTCYRCEVPLCERCVVLIKGQAICRDCARRHEETVTMRIEAERAAAEENALGDAVRSIRESRPVKRAVSSLKRTVSRVLFILVLAAFVGVVVFLPAIFRLAGGIAESTARDNRQNPLARLVILADAYVHLAYRRYDGAVHAYRLFRELYPQDERLPETSFRIGLCLLYQKDYRGARQAFEAVAAEFPQHRLAKEAKDKIELIDSILEHAGDLPGTPRAP